MRVVNEVKNFVIKYKTYIVIALILISSIIYIILQNIDDKSKITINDNEIQLQSREDKIAVYITGEVKNPGVYYIDENWRLDDLIKECGGLTEDADLSEINLAEKLNDSDKIDIPKIVLEESVETDNETTSEDEGLININKASKEELKTLNGIGDTLADNIIEYREKINLIQ